MRKEFYYFLVLLFAVALPMQAQQFVISGRLTDQSKQAIEWAELYLKAADSTVVKQTSTQANGQFVFEAVKSQSYILEVLYFGKTAYQKQLEIDADVDLGLIEITGDTELGEIVLEAQKKRIERKVDRMVFHVENTIMATGGDALDALRATPGIRVHNEKIAMVGKSGMSVLIDDRLIQLSGDDLVNFLKTIPSDQIKSIELITTPPAKYDAEGNSGLINIKLKTAKKDSWNALIGTAYLQRFYPSTSLQGSFNYNKNNFTIQAAINGGSATRRNVDQGKTYFTDELWSTNNPRKIEQDYISARLGIDYQVSPKWNTGLLYLGSFYKMNIDEDSQTTRSDYEFDKVNSYIKSLSESRTTPDLNSFNWHNTYKLDTIGREITMDLDYFTYQSRDQRDYRGNQWSADQIIIPNTYFAGLNTNLKKLNNISAKTDIALPTNWGNWTFGGKYSKTTTKNELAFYDKQSGMPILDLSQTNTFDYTEVNEAIYMGINKKLNSQWEAQLGLRLEATQTTGVSHNYDQTTKKDYLKWFPTFYLVYNSNEDNSLSLDYSKRVRRPNYEQLNPFRINENPFVYIEGNPILQPALRDNLSFSYTYKDKWINTLYLSKQTDGFEQVSIIDLNTNTTQIIPLNYLKEYAVGLTETLTFNTWSWWSSMNTLDVSYVYAKSSIPQTAETKEGTKTAFSSNNDFILNQNKTLLMSVNYWIDFPGVSSFYTESGSSSLDLAFKMIFLDKKLTLNLSANDVLGSQRGLSTSTTNGVKISYRNYFDSQSIRLAVNYTFGNSKLKVAKRNFGNQEENNRVN